MPLSCTISGIFNVKQWRTLEIWLIVIQGHINRLTDRQTDGRKSVLFCCRPYLYEKRACLSRGEVLKC